MINSKEYWNKRFKTGQWNEFAGGSQSEFFYILAINLMPEWLKREIIINKYSICDLGCAQGEGTNKLYKKFFNSEISGVDFSESAIEIASDKYAGINFLVDDITKFNKEYDILFSSNTLEHFRKPFEMLENIIDNGKFYTILLLPLDEKNPIDEHFSSFEFTNIPMEIKNSALIYYDTIDCTKLETSFWPGKQVLLVYANKTNVNMESLTLSQFNSGIEFHNETLQKQLKEQENKSKDLSAQLEQNQKEYESKELNNQAIIKQVREDYTKLENEHKNNQEIIQKITNRSQELQNQELINQEIIERITNHNQELQNQEIINHEIINKLASKQNEYEERVNEINVLTMQKYQMENTLKDIYNSGLWAMGSRYYKIRDSIKPIHWIHTKLKNKKQQSKIEMQENTVQSNVPQETLAQEKTTPKNELQTDIPIDFKSIDYNYKKQDIILLSVIDWDFRFQRPQHIAQNLAKLGHRVFYFDANYHHKKIKVNKEQENLQTVRLSNYYGLRIYDIDFNTDPKVFKEEISSVMHKYNIRDCSVIVEYPTWEPVAKYLKEDFGFKILFDYIDDYTGFEETNDSKLVSITKRLLEISDVTIATSEFLAEKASHYSKQVEIIRNGTEFKFFNQAVQENKNPNMTPKIGYYGAIAEWFDIEKVEYIAQNRPEIEIELIGNVSSDKCNVLKKYKNIKFLGEKDYKDLPDYLKDYDVCLIPFRADIDLIKATNPVKFYEYLSAGKKIVATEIPELELFRDKYVYLANDKEKFLEYVDLCIANEDDLATPEELIEEAKMHDWANRAKMIENVIEESHPLVSIIVVTYNNLDYTKQCIESIIDKTAYPSYEIIIVDNDSKDDTPQYLKQLESQHSNIHVILSETNTGFSGGNNIGIKKSKGEYIILLNNDTLVTRGWITGLIKHLDKEKIGFIGPVTNSIGNEAQIETTYKDIADMDEFAMRYTTNHHNELYEDINVLAMFCVAIKRNILNEVGLLDENYIVGMFEDDDYSMALKKKGYEVACAEDVFIHHYGRVSFKKLEDKKYKAVFETNKKHYEEKWDTVWTPHKYRQGVGH